MWIVTCGDDSGGGCLHKPRGAFRKSTSVWRRQMPKRYQGIAGGPWAAVAVLDQPTRFPSAVRKLMSKWGKLQITRDFIYALRHCRILSGLFPCHTVGCSQCEPCPGPKAQLLPRLPQPGNAVPSKVLKADTAWTLTQAAVGIKCLTRKAGHAPSLVSVAGDAE